MSSQPARSDASHPGNPWQRCCADPDCRSTSLSPRVHKGGWYCKVCNTFRRRAWDKGRETHVHYTSAKTPDADESNETRRRVWPCGHHGFRNIDGSVFTCWSEDCDARYGREQAQEFLSGGFSDGD